MTFDLFNWLIFSTCDVLREMTKAIFKIENFENDCSCRKSRNVNFNNIDSACNDWKTFNEIIIKKSICLKFFH